MNLQNIKINQDTYEICLLRFFLTIIHFQNMAKLIGKSCDIINIFYRVRSRKCYNTNAVYSYIKIY